VSAVAPDGRTLVSVDTDGTMKLWGVETEQVHAVLQGHIGQVYEVAFSPDGRTLASGDSDGTIKLWDAETGQDRATLQGHASSVEDVAFAPDGQTLASASKYRIKLWTAESW
ncbi:MAG: hypothetical protein U9Q81_23925, partial [Pseudomonadota bacterium]|nr:hypothetical protein [Pseudomonadota bacterium]